MSADVHMVRRGDDDERLPVVVRTQIVGAWTHEPCASIEAGNVIELTADELEWLLSVAGQAALQALRTPANDETETP